jgi:hypothetical protein
MTKEQLNPYFIKFLTQIEQKMDRGRLEYGDSSFQKDTIPLLKDIQEELVDICGWSIILWTRLEKLKEALKD